MLYLFRLGSRFGWLIILPMRTKKEQKETEKNVEIIISFRDYYTILCTPFSISIHLFASIIRFSLFVAHFNSQSVLPPAPSECRLHQSLQPSLELTSSYFICCCSEQPAREMVLLKPQKGTHHSTTTERSAARYVVLQVLFITSA